MWGGGGIVRPLVECPKCGSTEQHLIFRDIRNWFRLLLEIAVYPLAMLFNYYDFSGFDLHRQCDRCGMKFLGRMKLRRVRDLCLKCGYNLTGNESGTCPECGKPINPDK